MAGFISKREYDQLSKGVIKQAKEIEKEQNEKTLDEKIFNLANEFAVAGYGDIAVRLHSIHNRFLKQQNETYGGNK
jgi:hypothetical protein